MLSLLLAQATDTFSDYTATTAADTAAATGFLAVFAGFWIFFIILFLVGLAIWIWAIIDVTKRQFSNQQDKTTWLIVLIVSLVVGLSLLGAIIYLIVGRKKGTLPGGTSTPAAN